MTSVGLILVCLTLCVSGWHVSLCLLRRITKAGLCSCVLHRIARVGLCSRVSYTIWQGLVCVLMSLRLSAKGWFEFVCVLHWVT